MSNRDRLVELLKEADDATEVYNRDYPTYEKAMQAFYTSIADHLLANGVIVLPCAVGDTVWDIAGKEIKVQIVDGIEYRLDGFYIYANEDEWLGKLGELVFLTKEEAEVRLKELEGDKE